MYTCTKIQGGGGAGIITTCTKYRRDYVHLYKIQGRLGPPVQNTGEILFTLQNTGEIMYTFQNTGEIMSTCTKYREDYVHFTNCRGDYVHLHKMSSCSLLGEEFCLTSCFLR